MSRFLVGSALFAVAMLAIFGAGTANTVVSWINNLGNPSAEDRPDNSIAIAADLTPIQRAGSYVELQITPSAFQEAVQFEGLTGQGGTPPNAVGQAAQTTTTAPAAASDTSIPALW